MSEKRNDGEPAFPTSWPVTRCGELEGVLTKSGMSLRDYFAAQTLAGFAANTDLDRFFRDETGSAASVAQCAYRWADAMLEARKQ